MTTNTLFGPIEQIAPEPIDAPPPQPANAAPPPPHKHVRRSFIDEVEKALRRAGMPYVSVDECKKALFAGAKLKSFHCVAYGQKSGGPGPNWLIWCGRPTQATRADMTEWGKVFGEGFIVVYAKPRNHGLWFTTENGQALFMNDPNNVK